MFVRRKKKKNSTRTQTYTPNKLGVAHTTYTVYENYTKQPPMETILKIADFLLGRESNSNQTETSMLILTTHDPELGL